MSWGPVAEPSAPATDGRPVTMRRWPPRQILVTPPVLPTQTSPSSSGDGHTRPGAAAAGLGHVDRAGLADREPTRVVEAACHDLQ